MNDFVIYGVLGLLLSFSVPYQEELWFYGMHGTRLLSWLFIGIGFSGYLFDKSGVTPTPRRIILPLFGFALMAIASSLDGTVPVLADSLEGQHQQHIPTLVAQALAFGLGAFTLAGGLLLPGPRVQARAAEELA